MKYQNRINMNRIQELEAEIQRIKKEEADSKKAKYQHFVGKYVHRAHTSYEKIVGDEVVFDSIHVYYDNRGDEYNNDASVNLQGWGQAYAEELEKQLISHETFSKALNDCIDLIKRRLA